MNDGTLVPQPPHWSVYPPRFGPQPTDFTYYSLRCANADGTEVAVPFSKGDDITFRFLYWNQNANPKKADFYINFVAK